MNDDGDEDLPWFTPKHDVFYIPGLSLRIPRGEMRFLPQWALTVEMPLDAVTSFDAVIITDASAMGLQPPRLDQDTRGWITGEPYFAGECSERRRAEDWAKAQKKRRKR